MGSSPSKRCNQLPKLKTSEITEFSNQTLFPNDKIEKLYNHFYLISASKTDDGVIDLDEFCDRLGLSNQSLITQRIFHLFDTNHDGVINFREFLLGISTFINAYTEQNTEHFGALNERHLISASKLHEQIEVSFRLFDIRGNGCIYLDDFAQLLSSCIKENLTLELTDAQIEQIARRTYEKHFTSADENGQYIDKNSYKSMIWKNPECIRWLSVDLERVSEGARLLLKKKRRKPRCF